MTTLSPYLKLKLHVARHKYTKGQYAGSAPADTSRRGKSHFRVDYDAHRAFITFHNTRILTCAAGSDTIKLDSGGWDESPTTREAMRGAIYLATGEGMYLHTVRKNGYTQTAIAGRVFYDGMEFRGRELVSPAKPFKMYRTDREATKAVRDAAESFRAVLPVIHDGISRVSTHVRNAAWYSLGRTDKDRIMAAFQDPGRWPLLIAWFKRDTYQQTWAAIYSAATAGMRIVAPTN